MDDPWWVKLDLAQHHLKEIETAVGLYSDRHPYVAVPGPPREKNAQPNARRYVLRIFEQPDPLIAALVGEFAFDLRSALDNIVVAIAPAKRKHSAGFPIETRDLWATDSSGRFLIDDAQGRTAFASRLEELPADVVTIIQELQPHNRGDQAILDPLAIISRLDNLNKHRGLIAVSGAVFNVRSIVRIGAEILEQFAFGLRPDGAEVAYFALGTHAANGEVQVEVRGTASVLIPGNADGEFFKIPDALVPLPYYIRDEALLALEPFAPRPGNVSR